MNQCLLTNVLPRYGCSHHPVLRPDNAGNRKRLTWFPRARNSTFLCCGRHRRSLNLYWEPLRSCQLLLHDFSQVLKLILYNRNIQACFLQLCLSLHQNLLWLTNNLLGMFLTNLCEKTSSMNHCSSLLLFLIAPCICSKVDFTPEDFLFL